MYTFQKGNVTAVDRLINKSRQYAADFLNPGL